MSSSWDTSSDLVGRFYVHCHFSLQRRVCTTIYDIASVQGEANQAFAYFLS